MLVGERLESVRLSREESRVEFPILIPEILTLINFRTEVTKDLCTGAH